MVEHPLPDHAALTGKDVTIADGLPVIITEKDAVKCFHRELPDGDRVWYLPVDVSLSEAASAEVDALLERLADTVRS